MNNDSNSGIIQEIKKENFPKINEQYASPSTSPELTASPINIDKQKHSGYSFLNFFKRKESPEKGMINKQVPAYWWGK